MPRTARVAPGGSVFHVLNRANGRLRLFKKEGDYLAFEKLLIETELNVTWTFIQRNETVSANETVSGSD